MENDGFQVVNDRFSGSQLLQKPSIAPENETKKDNNKTTYNLIVIPISVASSISASSNFCS